MALNQNRCNHRYNLRSRGPINRCEICERDIDDDFRQRTQPFTPPNVGIIFENQQRRPTMDIFLRVQREVPSAFKTNEFQLLVIASNKIADYYDKLWNYPDHIIDVNDESSTLRKFDQPAAAAAAAKKRKIRNENIILIQSLHESGPSQINDGASTSKNVIQRLHGSGSSQMNDDASRFGGIVAESSDTQEREHEIKKLDMHFLKYQSHQIFLYFRHIQIYGNDPFIALKSSVSDELFSTCYQRNIHANRRFLRTFSTQFGIQPKNIVTYINETGKNPLYCKHPLDACDYFLKCNGTKPKPLTKRITVEPIHNKTPFTLKELCSPIIVKNLEKINLDKLDTCFEIYNNGEQVFIACGQPVLRKVFDMRSVILNAIVQRLSMYSKYRDKLVRKTKIYYRHLIENPLPYCIKCTRINLDCTCPACEYIKETCHYTSSLEFNGHQIICENIKNFYEKNNICATDGDHSQLLVTNQSAPIFGPDPEND